MTLQEAEQQMKAAIKHLEEEFSRMQVGRASSAMVEGLLVNSYGTSQPLKNMASISTPDATSLLIQPWDKGVLADIEKSIRERSDLGFNPMNDGSCIRINIPQPTEERRKELVKVAHAKGEETKISIRTTRQKRHTEIQNQLKAKEISEDESRGLDNKLQAVVDEMNKSVEEHVKNKEKDIMTV